MKAQNRTICKLPDRHDKQSAPVNIRQEALPSGAWQRHHALTVIMWSSLALLGCCSGGPAFGLMGHAGFGRRVIKTGGVRPAWRIRVGCLLLAARQFRFESSRGFQRLRTHRGGSGHSEHPPGRCEVRSLRAGAEPSVYPDTLAVSGQLLCMATARRCACPCAAR
jgi:hypothetical protein